jgi:hypothetical protein
MRIASFVKAIVSTFFQITFFSIQIDFRFFVALSLRGRERERETFKMKRNRETFYRKIIKNNYNNFNGICFVECLEEIENKNKDLN